jgi:hypothetical protein
MKNTPVSLVGIWKKARFVSCLSALFGCITLSLNAQTFSYYENLDNFGLMDQNNPLVSPAGVGPTACAPTSVANSLVYLYNTYNVPNLLQSSPEESAYPTVNALISDMGTTTNGTSFQGEVSGTSTYLGAGGQNVTPPVSIISGQAPGGLGGYNQIQNSLPTPLFLYNALKGNNAVDFGFAWYNPNNMTFTNGAHAVTLYGITYNSTTQTGSLAFIDPFGTGGGGVVITNATFQFLNAGTTNQFIFINGGYTGGGANNGNDPDNTLLSSQAGLISDFVIAVPEPTTFALLGVGVFALGARRYLWRR